ncbi:hypothetical protein BGW80DRAFT_1312047 [Lactifluus volemus]|nr:hypothetical protein BGW80DRAFT_1312047 [Lactifluus volemus]
MTSREPTREDIMFARRWVEELKRTAFVQLDGVAIAGLSVPESDVAEYGRSLNRLDKVLGSIEQYIHIAFVKMKKDDLIRRFYHVMAATKYQLGEVNKRNPRFILGLYTIRVLTQEMDNLDKGLKAMLGVRVRPFVVPGIGPPVP